MGKNPRPWNGQVELIGPSTFGTLLQQKSAAKKNKNCPRKTARKKRNCGKKNANKSRQSNTPPIENESTRTPLKSMFRCEF